MHSSEDLEHFRLIMGIVSLLDLCHDEKMYVVFQPSGSLQKWIASAKYYYPINVRLTAINVKPLGCCLPTISLTSLSLVPRLHIKRITSININRKHGKV